MIRNSAKLTALAAVALLGGAVVTSCSKTTNPTDVGTAKLALIIDGATVSSVAYTVLSSTNATLASGTINVSDPNATLSLDISLPPGTGDVVKLTATTSTGLPCTGTSPPFNVVSGQATNVTLTLTCGGGGQSTAPGSVGITATVVQGDNCPSIVASSASPAQTSVGGTISVSGLATDPDTSLTPPDVLTYAWAPAANFDAPTSPSTNYHCTAAGTQTLTLSVNDNHVPASCPLTTITMTVHCINVAVCGNGVIEPGETCDPPNGTTCSTLCQTQTPPPVCGNGIIETGETCDPPNGTTCDANCHTIVVAPVCGNGKVETGETCDPPNGTTCDATCHTIVQDNCAICEQTGTNAGVCFNTSPTGLGSTLATFGCNGFTSASDKANCVALLGCLQGASCQASIHAATADYGETGSNFDDPTPCLCNGATVAKAACLAASTWTGACAPQYVAAAAGGSVLSLFFSTDSPIGVANNLMTCDIDQPCTSAATCNVGH
jgi:hypothetical protein